MRTLKGALVVVLVLAAVSCTRSGPDWRIAQLFSGETTLDVLQHPTAVRMFRVGPADGGPIPEFHAGPYPALAATIELPPAAAAETSRILADPASYDWRRTKSGPFAPQIGVWFVRGAYVVQTAIDLSTAQISVHAGGQSLGTQAIDPVRDRLLAIAKSAFPDDAVIAEMH